MSLTATELLGVKSRRLTNEITSFLPEFWSEFNRKNFRMMSYVLNVLMPEAIIFLIMEKEGCSRHAVEQLLATPVESLEEELEEESSDSG